MSAVSNWIRRRLDSTGSSEGAAHAEEFVGYASVTPSVEEETQIGRNTVRKSVRRLTEPPSVYYETETAAKSGGRRSRHLSIGDPNVVTPVKSDSGSTYVKVKSQWQRAVRKISVSSGYNSGGSSTSSTPNPNGDASPTAGAVNRVRRTSMDKPNWGIRSAYGGQGPDIHLPPVQPRTRHLSLSSNVPPFSAYYYSQSPPRIIFDEQGLTKPVPGSKIPVGMMMVNQSPPQPQVISTLAMVRESKPSPARKSSTPEKDECDDDDDEDDEVESMSKLPYAVGKATPFPDGSEAVMIDSALALNAFQEESVRKVKMLKLCLHLRFAVAKTSATAAAFSMQGTLTGWIGSVQLTSSLI
jgi:hypothetical protein